MASSEGNFEQHLNTPGFTTSLKQGWKPNRHVFESACSPTFHSSFSSSKYHHCARDLSNQTCSAHAFDVFMQEGARWSHWVLRTLGWSSPDSFLINDIFQLTGSTTSWVILAKVYHVWLLEVELPLPRRGVISEKVAELQITVQVIEEALIPSGKEWNHLFRTE